MQYGYIDMGYGVRRFGSRSMLEQLGPKCFQSRHPMLCLSSKHKFLEVSATSQAPLRSSSQELIMIIVVAVGIYQLGKLTFGDRRTQPYRSSSEPPHGK